MGDRLGGEDRLVPGANGELQGSCMTEGLGKEAGRIVSVSNPRVQAHKRQITL